MADLKPPKIKGKTRAELLKEAKADDLFRSNLRCKGCGLPVDKDMVVCWACGNKEAVQIAPEKSSGTSP